MLVPEDPNAIWAQEITVGHREFKAWVWRLDGRFKFEVCEVTGGMRATCAMDAYCTSPLDARSRAYEFFAHIQDFLEKD